MQNEITKKSKHHLICGQRIELVPITPEHMDFMCRVETDVTLWYYEESVITDEKLVRRKFTDRINRDDVYDFIVRRISDGVPVGVVYTWQYIGERKIWEIGYALLPEFQGNGFCLESVRLLISFIFGELGAHKIVGMCNSENLRSASVMQKAGMSKQGVFREEYYWRGQWVDQFYFSLLEREYRSDYGNNRLALTSATASGR
ncbi:acetyltransferase [Longilinea arvoryzae]|uniref:Acetyltransferase n=1 Tax=Longilinea arvoryzae TaxID=360412 RepID=A0A0S7B9B5_9CHLR|nr:GNAT family N-acetyltransferase [Longilinea arvoryzae]GAP14060.1 acetyltransferase [Longilinea arvoryzae]